MRTTLPPALAALGAALLLSSIEAEVDPPSDLNFKIIDENTVHMSWARPADPIVGYKITVEPTTDGPTKEFTLAASTTETLLSELIPEIEYVVTITSYNEVEESVPVIGQLTKCSVSAWTDLVFLVDGSWSVGRNNFKYILDFIAALVSAFDIGEEKTRVGVVQYSSDTRTEFNLNQFYKRDELLAAIKRIPYKGGNTMTGDAIDYLIKNTFTESAGARAGFPKVAIIITDGKSQDEVEIPARELRNIGVEVFSLAADAKELKLIASTPSLNHVFNVANFDAIVDIQNEIISQVCSGVDEQLGELVSGEEVIEPPSNLIATEVSSKYVKLSWSPSPSPVTGYKVLLTPMTAGSRQHALSVGPQTTTLSVRDLSADTEYQISVSAMKGLTSSEPVSIMEKTQPMKVQVECSRVRAFLEVLVKSFEISPIEDIIEAINTFPYRGGSTNTGKAMTYVREKIFVPSKGSRSNVPKVMILITDGKSSDAFRDPAIKLRNSDVEIFAVGVKDAVRSELEAIASPPAETHVFTVEDFDAFQRISFELTQSICLRIEQELAAIKKKDDEVTVVEPASSNSVVLSSLKPETLYLVNVTAEYEDGFSIPVAGEETTEEVKGAPRNLKVTDETTDSFKITWTQAPGRVLRYRVIYRPVAGGESKEVTTPANQRRRTLENLTPDTKYEVSVIPEYFSGPGSPLTGNAATEEERGSPQDLITKDITDTSIGAYWTSAPGMVRVSEDAKTLKVDEETENTMRVTWKPAPGKVANYRVVYRPRGGGRQMVAKVPPTVTSTVLKRLQPQTTYDITVLPVYKTGEGKLRQGSGTTASRFKSPRNLKTSDPTMSSFRVTWEPAPGEVKGYKVTFHPTGDDRRLGELVVGPYDNTVVLEELRAGTTYKVNVFGMFDGGESSPLVGQEMTTLSDTTVMPVLSSGMECLTRAEADIVLLVDGSWSIGRANFRTVRSFISRIVEVFEIGPKRVQIALAQYSGDPRTEWQLNAHRDKKSLLQAVANLPYKGGNTLTGMALNFIRQQSFKTQAGMRPRARKIGVLITDGKSQDDVEAPSKKLKDEGVELFAIGIKNADEVELKMIATDPDDTHAYNVADFESLSKIVDDLTINLCNSVKGPGKFYVSRLESSTVLKDLKPDTEYVVNVYSVVEDEYSEPLKGTEKTLQVPIVSLNLYDVGSTTMHVQWQPVGGATGYTLLYEPLNATELTKPKEMRVGPTVNDVQLSELFPNTEYAVTVRAVLYDLTSEPVTAKEVTLPLPSPRDLKLRDVTHSTMNVLWDPAPGRVRKYIVRYKTPEEDVKEVEVDRSTASMPLKDLLSQTVYTVSVSAVYDEGESPPVTAQETTHTVPAPTNLQITDVTPESFRGTWDHGASDVSLYRITWAPSGSSDKMETILNGDENTLVFENLNPNTLYEVSVTAIYPDESESDDLIGSERTLRLIPLTTQGGRQNSVVLQKLKPDTPYTITVSSLYPDGEGGRMTGRGKTKPLTTVRNLRVYDPATSTLNVRWDHAEGNPRQYKLFYAPTAGGPEELVPIPGNTNYAILRNLQPDTPYTVTVVPVYPEGDGGRTSDTGRTLVRGLARNVQVYNPTPNSLDVRWDPAPGPVQQYRIVYSPLAGTRPSETIVVPGNTRTVHLERLIPDTPYSVNIIALYSDGEGNPSPAQGQTLPRSGPRNMRVFGETTNSLSVAWDHADGPVQQYRIIYSPTIGDPIDEYTTVPGRRNNVILQPLQPDTPYKITVIAVDEDGDGGHLTGNGRTGSNEPMEVFVGEVTSYTLHNLNPSTIYDVNVYAQYDSGLSVPLTDQGTT
ncbi:hypothetical protein CB1_000591007, partial [Camelus ferus]